MYALIKFDCLNIFITYVNNMLSKILNIPGISHILMPFVSTFNVAHDTYSHIKNSISHACDVYFNYVSDSFNTWYFITDIDFPVQNIYCSNLYEVAQWQYNRTGNILKYIRGNVDKYIIGLPFVSIDISVKDGRTFSMDSILEKFMYTTDGIHIPSPLLLMNIWSVHSRILLTSEDNPIMTVITMNGDIETFKVFVEEGDDDHDPHAWSEIFRENFEFEADDSSECDTSDNNEGDDEDEEEGDEDEEVVENEEVVEEEGVVEEEAVKEEEGSDDEEEKELSESNHVTSEEEEGEKNREVVAEEPLNTSEDVQNTYNIIATPQLSATNPTVIEANVPPISLSVPTKVHVNSFDIAIPSHVPDTPLKLSNLKISDEHMSSIVETFANIVNDVPSIEIDYSKVKEIIRNYPMSNLQDKNLEEVD